MPRLRVQGAAFDPGPHSTRLRLSAGLRGDVSGSHVSASWLFESDDPNGGGEMTDLANHRAAMELRALCVTARDALAKHHSGAQTLVEQLDRIEDSIAEPPRLKRLPHSKGTPPMTDNKPSAPERIWVDFVAYVRADLIPTPVSREAVADAVFNLAAVAYDAGHVKRGLDDTEVYPFIDRIMALIEGRKP